MTRTGDHSRDVRGTAGTVVEDQPGTVADTVALLAQPVNHPDAPESVTIVETHRSWVFLADRFAWKMRKPIRNDFVDFRSLEARLRDCEAEVRLNGRLTRGVYLAVVPVVRDASGALRLVDDATARGDAATARGGAATVRGDAATARGDVATVRAGVAHGAGGRDAGPHGGSPGGIAVGDVVVDWLVKMRRLPAHLMLDEVLRRGGPEDAALRRVVGALARAYRAAGPVEMSPAQYRDRLAADVEATTADLAEPGWGLPRAELAALRARLLGYLAGHADLLDARVLEGRVVEGHGDLRPEHICLEPRPQIIDCLEFSRDLRVADALDEISYLALECERLGAAARVREVLLAAWAEEAGDEPPPALAHAYAAYRACVRAKIAIWHWREPALRGSPKWGQRARDYLRLATGHAAHLG